MAQQQVHEGMPRELMAYLTQHPDGRFRLIELAEGEDAPTSEQPAPVLDEKAKAALAVLDAWIAEGKAADLWTNITP